MMMLNGKLSYYNLALGRDEPHTTFHCLNISVQTNVMDDSVPPLAWLAITCGE